MALRTKTPRRASTVRGLPPRSPRRKARERRTAQASASAARAACAAASWPAAVSLVLAPCWGAQDQAGGTSARSGPRCQTMPRKQSCSSTGSMFHLRMRLLRLGGASGAVATVMCGFLEQEVQPTTPTARTCSSEPVETTRSSTSCRSRNAAVCCRIESATERLSSVRGRVRGPMQIVMCSQCVVQLLGMPPLKAVAQRLRKRSLLSSLSTTAE
mmetsp:Transcript_11958/g.37409  ORF Transcript_11958/g.37409 Transcript_11958/m.37409 type:complete len:214 (+) Transcript_11958:125-766(+)